MPSLGKTVGYTVKGVRLTARGGRRGTRWVSRRVMFARHRGGAGEAGMTRLLDLHAISCAGDTLVTMGLAGTVFFSVAADAARGRVALYLLITMAPFAIVDLGGVRRERPAGVEPPPRAPPLTHERCDELRAGIERRAEDRCLGAGCLGTGGRRK